MWILLFFFSYSLETGADMTRAYMNRNKDNGKEEMKEREKKMVEKRV